jgi:hypothetical protein
LLMGPSGFKFTEGLPFQVDQIPGSSPLHPGVPAYPVVSTNGAARTLREERHNCQSPSISCMLENEFNYRYLFREIFKTIEPTSSP